MIAKLPTPTLVSGAVPGLGHSAEFIENPALFMLRAWRECGELAEFHLGDVRNILMVGPEAHEAVYRAPDDQLSAAEPYKYMVPVFGEGIQYGAPLEIERQQVKFLTHALRPEKMKGYARVIAQEVEDWIAGWGDAGERDFHDEFKDLVLRTSPRWNSASSPHSRHARSMKSAGLAMNSALWPSPGCAPETIRGRGVAAMETP